MTTAATSLLGLALPVTGELSGTWGDTVNNSITALLDSAVAGTTTLSADVDVTLTTTTLAANQAREAIILWTAAGTVTRYITAPAQSKIYAVLNKSSTQSIVLRGVGPTTGVTILAGKQAMVAWDGTDYVEISSGYVDGPATSTDNAVARFDGTDGKLLQNSVVIIADTTGNMTGVGTLSSGAITSSALTATRVLFAGTSGLIQDDADLTFNGTILTSTGFAGPLNGTVGATTPAAGSFTNITGSANAIISVTDNTNAALRITQLGTGNALLVEDSANPDSSPTVIDASGNLIVGYTSRVSSTSLIEAHSAASVSGAPAIATYSWDAANAGGMLALYKSQSDVVGTRALVSSGATSDLRFYFDDGVTFQRGASISGTVDGTPALNSMPGRLVFSTTADGASSPTERMRIDSTGNVGIGTTAPVVKLEIAGNNNTLWIVTASISGVTMDVTAVSSGTIAVGDLVYGTNIQPYTRVTALGTGTGGVGTYTVSVYQTVASSATTYGTTQYGATLIRITDIDTNQAIGQPNGALQFFTSDASTPTAGVSAYVAALAESVTPDTALVFGTRNNAGGGVDANERMRIDSDGNVGIGTNLPGAKLDVNGGALIQGLTVGRGAGSVGTNTAVGVSALAANTTGATNVSVGYQAGQSNTTGSDNVSVGVNALKNATTGASNVAVGYQTLVFNTTASNNTAVGYQAGYSNTTGASNTTLGYQAGFSNSTSSNNVAVGNQAGYSNTSQYQTFVGHQAGYNTTSGTGSTFLGHNAGNANVAGYYCTFTGAFAGYRSTGNANTTFGAWSLSGLNTGQENVSMGYYALQGNTSGSFNTALGATALYSNTTASNNTAVGYQAGYTNVTGTNNNYFGQGAGQLATGSQIDAFGNQALKNSTGDFNAAFGFIALRTNTSGGNNVAVGAYALQANTTASNNTAVGYQAGYSNLTGTEQAFFGAYAGYSTTGTGNTFLGRYSGYGASTGTLNTFIGNASGYAMTTGSKNTIVGSFSGSQGGLDIRTASNHIVLSDGDGNPRQIIDSSGNLGLGVTPSAWAAGTKAIEIGASSSISNIGTTTGVSIGANIYRDGSWKYKLSAERSTLYNQYNGEHSWSTAGTGTAGAAISFTQAMTLDASGNLLVGTTTTSAYLDGKLNVVASGTQPGICAKLDPASSNPSQFVYSAWAPFATGNNIFMSFETETSATIRGSISYNRAGGLTAYNTTSDYRAKDISGPVADSGALIDSVPVYMGKMKGATQERPMFIAHETPAYAHTGVKDAVDKDGNPVFQQMDASSLVPVLWAELQSLRKRLAAAGIA